MKKKPAQSAVQSERAEFPEKAIGENILENRTGELERDYIQQILAGDSNISGLRLKKETCRKKLDELKSPVKNPEELRYSLLDIDSYEKTLQKLKASEFDNVDIANFVGIGSDFGAFFSKRLTKKLEAARVVMERRDKTFNAFIPQASGSEFLTQAESEWEAAGHTEPEKNDKTKWINHRLAQMEAEQEIDEENRENLKFLETQEGKRLDEGQIKLIREQAGSEEIRQKRIHKRTIQKEDQKAFPVGKILPWEDRYELANILLEAKAIREERVKDYLSKRFETVAGKFESLKDKKPPRVSKGQIKDINRYLTGFKENYLHNPDLYKAGIRAITQVSENLDHVEKSLDDMDLDLKFVDDIGRDSEGFRAGIMRKVGAVQAAMREFTPERIDELLAKLDANEKARIAALRPDEKTKHDEFGESPNYIKTRTALLELRDGDSPFAKQVAEVEAQMESLDVTDPENSEELLNIKTSLDAIQRILAGFSGDKIDGVLDPEKQSPSVIARRAINLLAGETDVQKIKEVLEESLGKDHFALVSDNEFTHYKGAGDAVLDLKEFTGGNMVFYERGDEWKIIINEEGLKDGKSLKEQLTHELLHLEFENNKDLKEEWHKLFIRNDSWSEIRRAFLRAFPKKQSPHNNGLWDDDDIISEIFAMQNSLFADTPESGELKKAIRDSGITANALGVGQEVIRGFDKEDAQHAKAMAGEGGDETEGGGQVAEGAVGSFDSNKEAIEKNDKEIKRIMGLEYISYVPGGGEILNLMKKFNDNTSELNEKFGKIANIHNSKMIEERVEKVKKSIDEVEKQISMVADKIPSADINPLRDIWNRSQFFSLDDILQNAKDIKEWWIRRHTRRREDHAARIGSALFDKIDLPIISEYGAEAGARQLKAEHAEVDEWQNRLKHKDAWELEKMLNEMADGVDPNKDMFKAILRILAEKGRINWRNAYLWRLLNKLQNATKLGEDGGHPPEGDMDLLANPILLREKLHKAIGSIWDYDEYLRLERDAGAAYKSGKEKYFGGFDKIQNQITQRLEQLLADHRNGGRVDPQEYEGLIEYSIIKGKSSPEDCYFHLMAGVAEGILYADRPMALDGDYINKWPALQWIYHHKPPLTRASYKKTAEDNFDYDFKTGHCGDKFKRFYWTVVLNDGMVVQRVRKHVGKREWDHDWVRSIAVLGDSSTAKQFLQGRSGQQEVQDTAVENFYAGSLQWLEENAALDNVDLRGNFARHMASTTMADGIMDRAAYVTQNFTRAGAGLLQAIPREAGLGNHTDLTVAGDRDLIRDLFDKLDAPFFALIRNGTRAKSDKTGLGADTRDYLLKKYSGLQEVIGGATEIDDIYDQMDAIMQAIVFSYSPQEFNEIVKTWRAESLAK